MVIRVEPEHPGACSPAFHWTLDVGRSALGVCFATLNRLNSSTAQLLNNSTSDSRTDNRWRNNLTCILKPYPFGKDLAVDDRMTAESHGSAVRHEHAGKARSFR